jgi:hypothetical protein
VVQWKLPSLVLAFVQHAGRAARGSGRIGLAVLLVEQSVYQADLLQAYLGQNEGRNAKGKTKTQGIHENPNYPKSPEKGYAQSRGLLCGSHGGAFDGFEKATYKVPIDKNISDKGLYALVQTTIC